MFITILLLDLKRIPHKEVLKNRRKTSRFLETPGGVVLRNTETKLTSFSIVINKHQLEFY